MIFRNKFCWNYRGLGSVSYLNQLSVNHDSIQGQCYIQVNLIITLSLGSMETDRVIGEPCYNEVIYNRHIAK